MLQSPLVTSSNVDLDFGILVLVLVFRQTGSMERELAGGQRQAAVGSTRDQRDRVEVRKEGSGNGRSKC